VAIDPLRLLPADVPTPADRAAARRRLAGLREAAGAGNSLAILQLQAAGRLSRRQR
jgi:hypothetical protein